MAIIAFGHCQADQAESGEPAKVVDGWCLPCIPRDIPLPLMSEGGNAGYQPRPPERPWQCIKCLRPAELVPEVKGRPAELCAKAEMLNSTTGVAVPSDFARSALKGMSDQGCVRGAWDAGV